MSALRSGTLTFLFTDIEGSTRLWEAHPDAMRVALAQHDDLLRACIESHGGRVFKTVGDAFCAVFTDPRCAAETILAAQQWLPAMALETAEGLAPLRVRMALHTGNAEERDGDFFGQPLNRVARLLATGHGGQVLLSLATSELIRDNLPPGAELRSLGEHRLRDLGRPETIFQLLHPQLPADFPPLRSLDNPELKHNLPQQVTSFVGRGKELAEVRGLLGKTRLLTLTGAGGTGKTRLALQVGADLLDGRGDGVWFVELGALTDPSLVPQIVAGVLGLKEEAGNPILQTLIHHLKTKQLLLIVDNCEHLLDVCARLADNLLRSCPQVLLLATSREALGIAGELTYRVPSLSLPDPRRHTTPEALGAFESARLFIERAQFHDPHFAVTPANTPAVASVCYRLDGIPLAIELAAARVRSLTVEDINTRLDQRFRLLTGGSRTALPRQQTLRSLIDWSYDLLSEAEKALLGRLSVFQGGWTLEAAEQVCSGAPVEDWEVLELLTSLGDKSLVVSETTGASVRCRLLETVRQYARDRLEGAEGEHWRDRHLAYFLALGEKAEPELQGPDQLAWLEQLETEHDNVRAALEWSAGTPNGAEAGQRLCAAIWRFWLTRGHLTEGRARCASVLAGGQQCTGRARAGALNAGGALAWRQSDYAAARALFEESLAIRRELGDRAAIAGSLNNLGLVAQEQGDYAAARALFEESLAIRRELGDRGPIAASLNNLGLIARTQGDYEAARALHEEGLAIKRDLGDRGAIAGALNNLGIVARSQGDEAAAQALFEESLTIRRDLGDRGAMAASLHNLGLVARSRGDLGAARALCEESLAIFRDLGDRWSVAGSLKELGRIAQDRGDSEAARELYQESLAIFRDLGDRSGVASATEGLACVAAALGSPHSAARLFGAAERLRDEVGAPVTPDMRREYEAQVAAARAALGDSGVFDAAWAEGRTLTLEEAMARWHAGDQD